LQSQVPIKSSSIVWADEILGESKKAAKNNEKKRDKLASST